MADHQASKQTDEQEPEGTLPEGQTPVASSDDSEALKAEMIKHRQEAARLRKELEEAKKPVAKAETPAEPPPTPVTDAAMDRIEKLERQTQLRELMGDRGLDAKQADTVIDLMRDKGLDATEAQTLAALRDPELFSAEGESPAGFNPGMHGSTRPTSGATPPLQQQEGPDTESRLEHIAKLKASGNKKEYQRYLNNLSGSIASRQMKRSGHERLPIPK